MDSFRFVRGIDVSQWQPDIDWKKVRAQEIRFAFIKATQANFIDPSFQRHWSEAKLAGIACGAYHFLDPTISGKVQAEFFLRTVKLERGDLPPVLDLEEPSLSGSLPQQGSKGARAVKASKSAAPRKAQQVPNAQIITCAEQWLTLVEAESGRQPIIYSRASFLRDRLSGPNGQPPPWSMNYLLWLAQYLDRQITETDQPLSPPGWPEWRFWQYDEKGRVDGVNDGEQPVPVDLDFFNGTLQELYELTAESASVGSPNEASQSISQEVVSAEQPVSMSDINPPAEQNISVAPLAAAYLPPVAGYISDQADQDLRDLLNIEREVSNIANVLTFKQVQPPLALGLFGDWGSGKTFFMGKLRRYIAQIAEHYQQEEQRSEVASAWCSRVAQIEFNAWHFSDSNLWASLVTRIYEGLDRELNREKETADDIKKRIIEEQIREAKAKSIKAESQLDLAKTRVNSAEENLTRKRKEREGKENKLMSMISSLPELLKGTEFDQPLREAAATLGVPQAAESFEALEELDGQLKSLSGRLTAVTTSILRSPLTLVLMTIFVVILPVLLTMAIERWGTWLTDMGKRVAEISTFLLFVIGWLQAQVRRGLGLVGQVESALKEARHIRQTKIDQDQNVIAAKKALTEAQVEEQAARTNLEIAQTEFQRLQNELQELRPERKLQRLIETRSSTGVYAQHLGIISLIRSDFESMSRILSDMVEERRDFQKAPPIQRIVLYIDDLDRCKPERVVEVLEAIHLLLFFPLFVVVVAVDPRWLRHSLAQHYPATLSEKSGAVRSEEQAGLSLYSTPQDYLEKIFQIPFALRPVEKAGYQSLVDDLLKPLPPRQRRSVTRQVTQLSESQPRAEEGAAHTIEPVSIPEPGPEDSTVEQADERTETSGAGTEEVLPQEEQTFTPIPPKQLEFTRWEQDDIRLLWQMFRTPRTVKRFINIYRLLRAGLATDEEVKSFEGMEKNPGQYQVALLLLAAITAFPNESNQLLYRLDAWLDLQEANKRDKACTWQEIIQILRTDPRLAGQDGNPDRKRGSSGEQTKAPLPQQMEARKARDANQSKPMENIEQSWFLLLDCLERVTQADTWKKPFDLLTLRTWVLRVARFSFSVQPT